MTKIIAKNLQVKPSFLFFWYNIKFFVLILISILGIWTGLEISFKKMFETNSDFLVLILILAWTSAIFIIPMLFLWLLENTKPVELFREKLNRDIEKIATIKILTDKHAENFNEILSISQQIYQDLRAINPRLRWSIIFTKTTNQDILELRNRVYEDIMKKLTKLQKELMKSIENQKKITKVASSSLTEHINLINSWKYISILQQARLDRQIEQFEELQRVLVKV